MMVHSKKVNTVDFARASIIGAGLRDKEITLAFAKIITHVLKSQELSKNFPVDKKIP